MVVAMPAEPDEVRTQVPQIQRAVVHISPSSGKPAARRRQGNSPKARVPLGNTGRGLIAYPGFPHGMCTTNADVINADLLAFIRS